MSSSRHIGTFLHFYPIIHKTLKKKKVFQRFFAVVMVLFKELVKPSLVLQWFFG